MLLLVHHVANSSSSDASQLETFTLCIAHVPSAASNDAEYGSGP